MLPKTRVANATRRLVEGALADVGPVRWLGEPRSTARVLGRSLAAMDFIVEAQADAIEVALIRVARGAVVGLARDGRGVMTVTFDPVG